MGDGVWTVGVSDGVISTVETSLVWSVDECQDGAGQSGWGVGGEEAGRHEVLPIAAPQLSPTPSCAFVRHLDPASASLWVSSPPRPPKSQKLSSW